MIPCHSFISNRIYGLKIKPSNLSVRSFIESLIKHLNKNFDDRISTTIVKYTTALIINNTEHLKDLIKSINAETF
jgi:hypothetical protein